MSEKESKTEGQRSKVKKGEKVKEREEGEEEGREKGGGERILETIPSTHSIAPCLPTNTSDFFYCSIDSLHYFLD